MSDDRLRHELEGLERSAPAELPPRPWAERRALSPWRLVAPVATVALATLLVAVVAPRWIPSLAPSASPSTAGSASVARSPLPTAPTADPTPAPVLTQWTDVGSFVAPQGVVDHVSDATTWAGGIVAVGGRLAPPAQQYGDPIPETGLVWLSVDGRRWERTAPDDVFRGVELNHVLSLEDGSITAIGSGSADQPARFWRSTDGRSWTEVHDLGLPAEFWVRDVATGPRGFVIAGTQPSGYELWFSPDGKAWERVRSEPWNDQSRENLAGVAAGATGFAAFGWRSEGLWPRGESFALASPDGRRWADAIEPVDAGVTYLEVLNNTYVAIATQRRNEGGVYLPPPAPSVWSSADGSIWRQIGLLEPDPPKVGGDLACGTYLTGVVSGGHWLVASSDASCVREGTEQSLDGHATPLISTDGESWQPLPFDEFAVDPAANEVTAAGSTIRAAVSTADGLLLAGQSDGVVTFWLGMP